jgi:DNA-binding MurR/RpiR family transcriptional regulator
MKEGSKLINQKLSDSESFCWHYIESHLSDVQQMTMAQVSVAAHVSLSTVNRTINRMGYEGFAEFKYSIKDQKQRVKNGFSSEVNQAIDKNTIEITRTINQLSVEKIEEALRMLDHHNNVTLIALGLSTNVAKEMVAKLQLFDKNCTVYEDPEFMKFHAGKMNRSDLVIAISLTGRTNEIVETVKIAKKHEAGVLALTAGADSPLAKLADTCLCAYKSSLRELDFGLDVASRIPLHIIGRILLDTFAIYKSAKPIREGS